MNRASILENVISLTGLDASAPRPQAREGGLRLLPGGHRRSLHLFGVYKSMLSQRVGYFHASAKSHTEGRGAAFGQRPTRRPIPPSLAKHGGTPASWLFSEGDSNGSEVAPIVRRSTANRRSSIHESPWGGISLS
jgi:hypothetical protein